jgi:hypothetical protein
MVIPTSAPSILIFELNRKILLYKILNTCLAKELRKEIIKLFGVNYVNEKNVENRNKKVDIEGEEPANESMPKNTSMETSKTSADSFLDSSIEDDESELSTEQNTETDNTLKLRTSSPTYDTQPQVKPSLTLTNDLIYEFFAPMINSFEITREISYCYEYALIDRSKYTIRFYLYTNCLILLIYNFGDVQAYLSSSSIRASSELTRQVYIDFYTNWFNKSLISLLKFKFGICSDEKCFKLSANKKEIKRLYLKWSEYFLNDQAFFVESIDQLVVNDDIKAKCKHFLDDLVAFLYNMDSILTDFDYLDEYFDRNRSSQSHGDKHGGGDMEFLNENEDEENLMSQLSGKSFEIEEFEKFFSDPTQINQFMLAYNSKLLYKYKKSASNVREKYVNNSFGFSIDSSSIFMLLLEAAEFLNYSVPPLVDTDKANVATNVESSYSSDSDSDRFESASGSKSESESSDLEEEEVLKVPRENSEKHGEDNLNLSMPNASFAETFMTPMSSSSNFFRENFEKDLNKLVLNTFLILTLCGLLINFLFFCLVKNKDRAHC